MFFQIPVISVSIVSMLNSFEAFYPISTQASTCFKRPSFRTVLNVNSGSFGLISCPMSFDTSAQCLSFMPSFLRATIKGSFGLNSSMLFLTASPIEAMCGMDLSLKYLFALIILLKLSSTNFSAALASMVSNWLFIQTLMSVYQRCTIDHKVL